MLAKFLVRQPGDNRNRHQVALLHQRRELRRTERHDPARQVSHCDQRVGAFQRIHQHQRGSIHLRARMNRVFARNAFDLAIRVTDGQSARLRQTNLGRIQRKLARESKNFKWVINHYDPVAMGFQPTSIFQSSCLHQAESQAASRAEPSALAHGPALLRRWAHLGFQTLSIQVLRLAISPAWWVEKIQRTLRVSTLRRIRPRMNPVRERICLDRMWSPHRNLGVNCYGWLVCSTVDPKDCDLVPGIRHQTARRPFARRPSVDSFHHSIHRPFRGDASAPSWAEVPCAS